MKVHFRDRIINPFTLFIERPVSEHNSLNWDLERKFIMSLCLAMEEWHSSQDASFTIYSVPLSCIKNKLCGCIFTLVTNLLLLLLFFLFQEGLVTMCGLTILLLFCVLSSVFII